MAMTNDDMKMEDITPEMLGCMGEQETDPGVVEETQKVDKPARLCFINIPFEKRKAFKLLYDQFEERDMPFEDFCIELYAVQSPGMMQRDLGDIIDQKHAGYQRKAAVDYNLTHRN